MGSADFDCSKAETLLFYGRFLVVPRILGFFLCSSLGEDFRNPGAQALERYRVVDAVCPYHVADELGEVHFLYPSSF